MSELQVGDRVQTGIDVWYTLSFLSENMLRIKGNIKMASMMKTLKYYVYISIHFSN